MRNYLIIALVFFLLVSLFGNYVQHDLLNSKASGEEATKSGLKLEIEQANRRTAARDTAIAIIQFKMDSAHSRSLEIIGGHQRAVMSLKRKERLSRTDTVTLTLVDTVYLAYDSTIAALTVDRDAIKRDCQTLTDSLLAQITDFKAIGDLQGQRADIAEAGERRMKKRVNVFKWLAIVAAGWAIEEQIRN